MKKLYSSTEYYYNDEKVLTKNKKKGYEIWVKDDEENKKFYSHEDIDKNFIIPRQEVISQQRELVKEFIKLNNLKKTKYVINGHLLDVYVLDASKQPKADPNSDFITLKVIEENNLWYVEGNLKDVKVRTLNIRKSDINGTLV